MSELYFLRDSECYIPFDEYKIITMRIDKLNSFNYSNETFISLQNFYNTIPE